MWLWVFLLLFARSAWNSQFYTSASRVAGIIGTHPCTWLQSILNGVNSKRTGKLVFIKIKAFFPIYDTVKRMQRQATSWEKIFANQVSEKVLLFGIKNFQTQQENNPTKHLNKHFKNYKLIANKHMKRCSTSISIRKMQSKITMRYWYSTIRMS